MPHPDREAVCHVCEDEYTATNNAQRYCSSPCFEEARRERGRLSYWRNVEERRLMARLYKYGLSRQDYERLRDRAMGLCEICGEAETQEHGLYIDHDHTTGEVRGLLCNSCNAALPIIERLLEPALRYLEDCK